MGNEEVPQGTAGELAAKTKAPRRTPEEQDQEIQNYINEARQSIKQALETPATLAKLATLGFSVARLTDGATLAEAAVTAFAARQRALGEADKGVAAAKAAQATAQSGIVRFREAIRIATSDKTIQTALGVTGRIPKDGEKFLTAAQASLKTAAQAPYAALVASVGYDSAALAALAALVESFATARRSSSEAQAHAKATTAARNEAVKALRVFTTPFYRALRL
jgi:hypothetical protein